MQGGEIGVASTAGQGSTFQFYVKTRRTHAPAEVEDGKDFQLLVREDALREACAVEISALQNGVKMPNVQPEEGRLMSPRLPQEGKGKKGEVFHILVVEDNLVNQRVVSKQLRKEGHVVSVANHGEEALDFIRKSEFWDETDPPGAGEVDGNRSENETKENGNSGERLNVILMDLEMPVMDGITCVKRIRELQIEGKIKRHVPVIAVTANARKDQILKSLDAGMVSYFHYYPMMVARSIRPLIWQDTAHLG
jgi:CheY-like chemotaxis protein